MKRRLSIKKIFWSLGLLVAGWLGLNILFPLPYEKLHPPASTTLLDREGVLLRAFLAPDDMWRIPVREGEIPQVLKDAVIAYEDRRFYYHVGIDPVAVVRALVVNIETGSVRQGGSTLTMQVARMMDPKDRTLPNKLIEAFRALQLEWRYSKEELITLYFNLAPYGGNVVGVGAASYLYFDKKPEQLSLGEAALLAAIPNNPNRYRPDFNPEEARRARAKVLRLMAEKGTISSPKATDAETEPVPRSRYKLPFLAPHLADLLHRQTNDALRLETTLDARLQAHVEAQLRDYLQPWLSQGITNGAVVVLDNASKEVRALVGSRAFFDEGNDGQVNAALARRSPGSALKPFVYALALDQGLIAPRTLLADIPVDFSGYQPQNFNNTFHGVVSAEEALMQSLNVPAVNLSAQLPGQGLYAFLKEAGLTTLTEPEHHYGLSLILGGGEVTLLELTTLYAGLANGGQFQPFRWLQADSLPAPKPLLNPGAVHLITEVLSEVRRPELPAVWESSRDLPRVAWKTGTSYDHRDAWSIGYTPRFTVGVWIGNMDGQGNPALVGAEMAAPLMFQLMSYLEGRSGGGWFLRPATVESRRVCAKSGGLVTAQCYASRTEWFLPGHSPVQSCTLHQTILIDRKTGHRLCSYCKEGRSFSEKVVEQWPAEVAVWLQNNGYPLDKIPEHWPGCTRPAAGEAPVIRSPQSHAEYRLRKGIDPAFQKILLEASVSNTTRTIYWFVDGVLIFSGNPTERVFLVPTPGTHTLMCMDDEGRSNQLKITIHE